MKSTCIHSRRKEIEQRAPIYLQQRRSLIASLIAALSPLALEARFVSPSLYDEHLLTVSSSISGEFIGIIVDEAMETSSSA
ncbi:hypothetical protein YC2023_017336 [Brassica napus]